MKVTATQFRGNLVVNRSLTQEITTLPPGSTLLLNLNITTPVQVGDSFRIEIPIPAEKDGRLNRVLRSIRSKVIRREFLPLSLFV